MDWPLVDLVRHAVSPDGAWHLKEVGAAVTLCGVSVSLVTWGIHKFKTVVAGGKRACKDCVRESEKLIGVRPNRKSKRR